MRFLSNPNRQKKNIIQEEFTRYFVNGKLKRRPQISTSPVHPFAFTPIQRQEELPTPVSERTPIPETPHQHQHDASPRYQEEIVCEDCEDCEIEDFPPDLNGCFSNEGFDAEHFEDFAGDF